MLKPSGGVLKKLMDPANMKMSAKPDDKKNKKDKKSVLANRFGMKKK